MRVSILSYKMPEVRGTQTGVFSKIPRHDADQDRRYHNTTYKDTYNAYFKEFTPADTNTFQTNKVSAGSETGFKKDDMIRITSKLIAENYNTLEEPKYNSAIQRNWNYKKDPGMTAVKDLNIANTQKLILPPIDNELSLDMGNGRHFETMRSKILENTKKRGTDITRTTIKMGNLRR